MQFIHAKQIETLCDQPAHNLNRCFATYNALFLFYSQIAYSFLVLCGFPPGQTPTLSVDPGDPARPVHLHGTLPPSSMII